MPPLLFVVIVLAGWTDPALEVSEAIERIERRHGEEVDLFHFLDDRMGLGKRGPWWFFLQRYGRALDGGIRLFQLGQDLLRPGDDRWRESRQFGDMNTVTAVCAARHNFTQEDHVSIPFLDRDAIVSDPLP